MNKLTMRSALALPLALCAAPALSGESHPAYRADSHAPAGVMEDHVHKAGDVMIGLSWMHEDYGGTNHSGTAAISDAAVIAAGYTTRADHMTMDMAMLHVMYAPSNRLTLIIMPSYSRMTMTMLGIAPSTGTGHHALAVGATARETVSGIGDTRIGALLALSRDPRLSVHAGLTLSIPTGSTARKDESGNFVHYGMQPGSGTWDLSPSVTLRGSGKSLSWGVQTSYLFRAEDRNVSGFRFGDRFAATGWVSQSLGARASLSARLAYSNEGKVLGHYNSGHSHAAPPDRQANYGGNRIEAGLGGNLVISDRLRLGVEATVPLWQKLNGIQPPKRFGGSLNLAKAF
jgi:Putative MetA-pathway of phenol degradation